MGRPLGLLGGQLRGLGRLVGQLPRGRQRVGRVSDKLLCSPLRFLSLTFDLNDLFLDIFRDFLASLFSLRFRVLAFAPYEFLGRFLGLCNTPSDVRSRFAVDLLEAVPSTFGHLARVFGECLGFPRGLHGTLLGLLSPISGVARASGTDLDGLAGIDEGRSQVAPVPGTHPFNRVRGLYEPRQQPDCIRRHLP